jgi:hypothetical protein
VIKSHAPSTAAIAKQVFGNVGSISADRAPIAIRKHSAVPSVVMIASVVVGDEAQLVLGLGGGVSSKT